MDRCMVCNKLFFDHDEQQITQCAIVTRENERILIKHFNNLPGIDQ